MTFIVENNLASDPVTVEVVRNKFDGIANEMQASLIRSSFSSIVKEGMDASASLFTLQGETLAQALAIPIHLATLIPMVKTLISTFDPEAMSPGDAFIMNDPYMGGTHLPDIAMLVPAFAEGKVFAFAVTITHHQDVGGMSPGSIPTNSTSIYQEGLRLPPIKIRSNGGQLDQNVINIIHKNVRLPQVFQGDFNAQISACSVGVRRLEELAVKYSRTGIVSLIDEILDRSEALTRAALKQIPQGTFEYTDYLDNDGINLDQRINITARVTISDGKFLCDFSRSSAQVDGPFNAVPSGALAAACFSIRTLTDPTIPTNGGCFRPIELVLPEGSVVNPKEPAPVSSRSATIKRITSAILGAVRPMMEDKVPADSAGVLVMTAFGGSYADGSPFVMGDIVVAGSGAGRDHDGTDVIDTDATNSTNNPVEAIELEFPIRIHRYECAPNSGGAGRYRGGLGCIREYEILSGPITFTHRGERHYVPAQGYKGGRPGGLSETLIYRAGGAVEVVPSKLVTVLQTGDRVVIKTAGGGGWGDPSDRPIEEVLRDLADRKITQDEWA